MYDHHAAPAELAPSLAPGKGTRMAVDEDDSAPSPRDAGPQQALPDRQTPSTASSLPEPTAFTNCW
jgi:hypothetical protein